ncbi:MAG: hypothetical protein ACFFD5_05965 [Candidatus Thorarchaeota archaeon]
MARELTPNRWNWSQKDGHWVYIELSPNGQKNYYYQLKPPEQFRYLTMKIKKLNDKLISCHTHEENERIFNEMMKFSKKLQCMGRVD